MALQAVKTPISSVVSGLAAPDEWPQSRIDFIKRNFCAGAPAHLADVFTGLCQRRNLSPEARHIYLVKRKDRGQETWVPQLSIDGYRLIAARTGVYAGSDDAIFEENKDGVSKATVTVWKIVAGVRCPFTATAHWAEYYPGDPMGFMWRKMPHVMLAKCAEALALRKAFPEDLSGMYVEEEMEQAGAPLAATHPDVIVAAPHPMVAAQSAKFVDRIIAANTSDDRKQQYKELLQEAVREESAEKGEALVRLMAELSDAKTTYDYLASKGVFSEGMFNAINEREMQAEGVVVIDPADVDLMPVVEDAPRVPAQDWADKEAVLQGTITDKQMGFMAKLQKDIGMSDSDIHKKIAEDYDVDSRRKLSKQQASEVIKWLEGLK